MEPTAGNDSIHESITVGAPQEKAFYAFSQQMTSWWPRRYTWSGPDLNHIVLDPDEGAAWYEVSESGERQPEWGRLLTWEPPSHLVLSWMVGASRRPEPDASMASEIDVTFTPEGPGRTRVDIQHRALRNHGEGWAAYRDGMASRDGWPAILNDFAQYVGHQESVYEDMEEHRAAS